MKNENTYSIEQKMVNLLDAEGGKLKVDFHRDLLDNGNVLTSCRLGVYSEATQQSLSTWLTLSEKEAAEAEALLFTSADDFTKLFVHKLKEQAS